MEVEEEKGEVCFTIKVKEFSSYLDFSQIFTTEFPLSVNKLRFLWRLTLSPFMKDNQCSGEDSIHRDIGITLNCLTCNINSPQIEIFSEVLGKDQHERQLKQNCQTELNWQGILTPRLSLKVFNLLKDDQLTARLRFIVKGSGMVRAVGGIEGCATDIGKLLKTGEDSDVDIVSSDGVRIPVHSAILRCRSTLLQRISVTKKRILPLETTPERDRKYPKTDCFPFKAETPINSTFGSMSSGYQSSTSVALSPESARGEYNIVSQKGLTSSTSNFYQSKGVTPSKQQSNIHSSQAGTPHQKLFRARATPSKAYEVSGTASPDKQSVTPGKNTPVKVLFSPLKNSASKTASTPKRLSLSKKPPTPRRVSNYMLSLTPSKLSPVQNTLASRNSPIGKRPPTPKSVSPTKRLKSPVLLPASKHMLLRRTPICGPSPRRRLYQDSSEESQHNDNLKTACSQGVSSTSSVGAILKESPVKALQSALRDIPGKEIIEFVDISPKPEIRVNMSASVTLSLLEWIYTGQCNNMDRLARALLVGGSRHGVLDLARACEHHLATALTSSNAPETLFLAYKYKAEILKEAALDYAVQQAADVTSQSMWATLSEKMPNLVLEFSRRLALHSQCLSRNNGSSERE